MALFASSLDLESLNSRMIPELERAGKFRLVELGEDFIRAEFEVTSAVTQPFGILHGGYSCVVAEGLGSLAGHLVLQDPTKTVVGQSLQASHIRSGRLGTRLEATARLIHLGGRSQIWDIVIEDPATHQLIAKVSLTLAVITKRSPD